jgi:ABC-2 type transport system permease protein
MRDLVRLSWAETVKLLKRRLTWVLLLVLVVVLVMRINNVHGHAFDEPPDWITPLTILPEDYRRAAVLPAVFDRARLSYDWLNISLILLAALTVGQEFAWGTMRTALARGPGRTRLLIAKFIALAAVAAFYLLALWIACGIIGIFTTRSLDGGVSWSFLSGAFLGQEMAALVRTWVIIWPVIAVAIWIALCARNPGLPINLVGLAYFLEWMTFASFGLILMLIVEVTGKGSNEGVTRFWGTLMTLIPHYNSAVVLHWGRPGKLAQIDLAALSTAETWNLPHDPWRCLALLLGYGLVALALALWTFRRKDVTA